VTDREEIRRMMEQEQAEGAMRDCIEFYRKQMMDMAMQLRGAYLAYVNVGFSESQALMLTIQSIK
jgi:hypothetical protein